jgi:DNA-binding CsgD family transcriptional regulator
LPRTWEAAGLAGGFGLPASQPVAGKIEHSYVQRLRLLPADTRLLVLTAAAEPLGDPVLLHRAAGALGIDMMAAAPAVDAGFAERTRRELLATGAAVRQRTANAVEQLTEQEALIARLARDGLSNPEIGAQLFLSSRTVEWHLRKVFTKLGVSSRRQLQLAMADRGRPVTTGW